MMQQDKYLKKIFNVYPGIRWQKDFRVIMSSRESFNVLNSSLNRFDVITEGSNHGEKIAYKNIL